MMHLSMACPTLHTWGQMRCWRRGRGGGGEGIAIGIFPKGLVLSWHRLSPLKFSFVVCKLSGFL